MPVPSTPTPAERFALSIRGLTQEVWTRTHFGLSLALIALITDRLRGINQRVRRLIARIRAGTYAPPRRGPRGHPHTGIRRPDKLPQRFGWLLKLVPEALAYRAQFEHLLRDDEMAALLAAAPGALHRPIRSLCRMLGLPPPPILAMPPAPPAAAPQAPPPPPPPPPQPMAPPPGPRRRPASRPAPPARACGPPIPA